MTRWPTRAIFSLTSGPIAATTPHGSWPPMTGFGLTGRPPIDSPPDLGRRYWCRSLPHIPEAFISTTTSPGPGVGSGNSIISISRPPVKTTPRIGSSAFVTIAGTSLRFFARRRDNPSFASRLTGDLSGFRIVRKGGGEWDGRKCCKGSKSRWGCPRQTMVKSRRRAPRQPELTWPDDQLLSAADTAPAAVEAFSDFDHAGRGARRPRQIHDGRWVR